MIDKLTTLSSLLLISALALLTYVLGEYWIFAPCGPVDFRRTQTEFDSMLAHMQTIEEYAASNRGPDHSIPNTLMQRTLADIATLEIAGRYGGCYDAALDSLYCTLSVEADYYQARSLEPRFEDLQKQSQYESCLRNYFTDMEALGSRQPFYLFQQ